LVYQEMMRSGELFSVVGVTTLRSLHWFDTSVSWAIERTFIVSYVTLHATVRICRCQLLMQNSAELDARRN